TTSDDKIYKATEKEGTIDDSKWSEDLKNYHGFIWREAGHGNCVLTAIDKAQKELKKNSDIKVPILLIHSDKSFIAKEENEDAQIADIVLNIKDMLSIKLCNENLMNTEKIKDAKHDVFLSRNKSREMAFKTMFGWLKSK
uniref:hypothetical protein n=1 Tax=Ilyobacter sp. TaxID=3100343 RepID=UPI003569EFAA